MLTMPTIFRWPARIAAAGAFLAIAVQGASAIEIQRVVSPGGIEAWLVEDYTVPLVTVDVAFEGAGAAQDPADKAGLANLVSGLLDEGAGTLGSAAFQERLKDEATQLSFDVGRDHFYGDLRTLSTGFEEGLGMLRLALVEPRFDPEAIERVRAQVITGIRSADRDPDERAARLWSRTAYPDHPYGRPTEGTQETVAAITRDDLVGFHRRSLARDNLHVAVVGAIDAATLGPLLDETFGDLPATAELAPVPDVTPVGGLTVREQLPVPQTAVRFGMNGLKRADPDFMAAFVMNHILGGGTFSSWLFEEVREKRGLAYSVYSYIVPFDAGGIFGGGTSTRADQAGEALGVILAQIERMAAEGPSEEELADAKRFLTGEYALRFSSSGAIARQLLAIQLEDLGIDYVDRRNALVEAVTLEDLRRVAGRILSEPPTIALVGPGEV